MPNNWNNVRTPSNPYYPISNPYQYNNYLNRQYQSQLPNQQQQQFYTNNITSQNNIIWVKGKENARSMQLAPNSTVILLDSEVGKFYIKTTDDIGLGKLRIFNYVEEPDIQTSENASNSSSISNLDLSNYVTKTQLDQIIKEIKQNESVSRIESKTTDNVAKQKPSIINKQF